MSNEHSMRRVTAIRNGTVIDHIPQGQALAVLEMLGITDATSVPVSLVMNVPSKKMGNKDIIKVEDRELTQGELDRLALVAPDANVAIIRAYTVAEKMIINLLNMKLFSSIEPLFSKKSKTSFIVDSSGYLTL